MFEGLWSRHTHPKDFPTNEWLTHFSDIIGASHSADYRVWEYGGIASDGLRQVAEWGATRQLETELKSEVLVNAEAIKLESERAENHMSLLIEHFIDSFLLYFCGFRATISERLLNHEVYGIPTSTARRMQYFASIANIT